MKEAFFILIVFLVILVLTAVRYRKQIMAAVEIWRSLKTVRNRIKQQQGQVGQKEDVSSGPLVNCARCGTWVPEQRAVRLRGGSVYCSSACLEATGSVR